jgi:hypothetical protein
MEQLRAMVPGCEVVADPVAKFDPDYLLSQPPKALELGCDPDFNAWSGEQNEKPDVDKPMRTAAGHVHIGFLEPGTMPDEMLFETARTITKQMDFYLGLPSLLFDHDQERREMYGQAGAFRPKPYGVEYRVLSNRWLDSEHLMRWVFRSSLLAMQTVRERQLHEVYGDIQDIINTGDIASARRIIENEGIPVPEGV